MSERTECQGGTEASPAVELSRRFVTQEGVVLQALAPAPGLLEDPDPGAAERPAGIHGDGFSGVPLEVRTS